MVQDMVTDINKVSKVANELLRGPKLVKICTSRHRGTKGVVSKSPNIKVCWLWPTYSHFKSNRIELDI